MIDPVLRAVSRAIASAQGRGLCVDDQAFAAIQACRRATFEREERDARRNSGGVAGVDFSLPDAGPERSLRDVLVEAGVGGWRGALGADERPLLTGMVGELAENVTIAGDYLPVRLSEHTPVRVDGIFFDKREDWCVVELIYPHTTGLRRARVRCNAVRG